MTGFAFGWVLLPLALVIDLGAGDPPWLPHPIRLMMLSTLLSAVLMTGLHVLVLGLKL